jgi:hypothetical protein
MRFFIKGCRKYVSPFYVKDVEKALPLIEQQGNQTFIRNWFDNRIDETIMENPENTAGILSEFMVEKIKHLKEHQIAICVSHDWNIFPLKEVKLGLKHEIHGDIGYLDGIIFFEKENQYLNFLRSKFISIHSPMWRLPIIKAKICNRLPHYQVENVIYHLFR